MEGLITHAKKSNAELEIHFVGEKKIQQLNNKYLKKNKVTDVLSFPLDWERPFPTLPWQLGSIVICTQVAIKQARRSKRSLEAQVLRLCVHGWVHLSGLDHEKSLQEKQIFEQQEEKYLTFLNHKGLITWDGYLQF